MDRTKVQRLTSLYTGNRGWKTTWILEKEFSATRDTLAKKGSSPREKNALERNLRRRSLPSMELSHHTGLKWSTPSEKSKFFELCHLRGGKPWNDTRKCSLFFVKSPIWKNISSQFPSKTSITARLINPSCDSFSSSSNFQIFLNIESNCNSFVSNCNKILNQKF